jgi:hypothetical protein
MEMISARYLQPQQGTRNTGTEASLREIVAAHFRACTNGVTAPTAHERMKRFYRSSGHAWSLALA